MTKKQMIDYIDTHYDWFVRMQVGLGHHNWWYADRDTNDCINVKMYAGVDKPEPVKTEIKEANDVCNSYLKRESIQLFESGDSAFYQITNDYIQLPAASSFSTQDARYSVLYHEMVHSTGIEGRLNRFKTDGKQDFGSESYSKEELVAEIGSSILCHLTGVKPDINHSASYIGSWLKRLKDDRGLIISASSKADKASKYIIEGAK